MNSICQLGLYHFNNITAATIPMTIDSVTIDSS